MMTKEMGAVGLAFAVVLALPAVSRAQYYLTANDANAATTSFNGAGNWNSGAAPAAGNTYITEGWLIRVPDVTGSYTFAGDSLTVGGPTATGATAFSPVTANNDALIFKANGESATVNNLVLDGGQIRDGNGDGNNAYLYGNISVTANGGAFMAQETNWIASAISGSSTIYIGDNGSGGATRQVIFTSGANSFTGNIWMTNSHSSVNYSRLILAPGSVWNFVIGANGVNNSIFGQGTLQLNGNLAINLTGADNTVGDTWSLVGSALSTTYGSTFAINGFTQNGTLWDEMANGVDYEFSETSGLLTVVPEPGACALLLAGGMLLACRRLRKV
jgi:hypothetical protein